ncbi:hypothetical protein BurJV3_1985 [Stenotrophomonas maltophilia JV3]|nr:hypothetical protein BurJV3_1985 [Stenotrophomonas maltophilia JV3]
MAGQGDGDPDWIGSHDAATDADANLPQAGLTDVTVRSVTMTSGRARIAGMTKGQQPGLALSKWRSAPTAYFMR